MRRQLEFMRNATVPGEFSAADGGFHYVLCSQANRPRMLALIENLRKHTDRYLYLHLNTLENTDYLLVDHANLVEAAGSGDAELAATLTRQYVMVSHILIFPYVPEAQETGAKSPGKATGSTG